MSPTPLDVTSAEGGRKLVTTSSRSTPATRLKRLAREEVLQLNGSSCSGLHVVWALTFDLSGRGDPSWNKNSHQQSSWAHWGTQGSQLFFKIWMCMFWTGKCLFGLQQRERFEWHQNCSCEWCRHWRAWWMDCRRNGLRGGKKDWEEEKEKIFSCEWEVAEQPHDKIFRFYSSIEAFRGRNIAKKSQLFGKLWNNLLEENKLW